MAKCGESRRALFEANERVALTALPVNGGGIMRQSGRVKLYHGLGGSLSP